MHAESITCEPTNKVGLNNNSYIDKYQCLNKFPEKLTSCSDTYVHPNNKSCEIIKDDDTILLCKGYDDIPVHEHTHVEKETCFACKESACRHCCKIDKNNHITLCIN